MAGGISGQDLALIFVTGFLPPILWLWFWLHEDPHPEPRKKLIQSFTAGMLIVPVALFLEFVFYRSSVELGFVKEGELTSVFLLAGWAFVEEVSKFWAAWQVDLKRSVYNEPVDALIYLLTVALGFSALENVLFLWGAAQNGGVLESAITANMRFFGATLLHTVSSGVVGASIALSFFHKEHQHRNIVGGLLLATILHGAFNTLIIYSGSVGSIFKVFSVIWTLVIILIFVFEKVKKIHS